MNEPTMKEYFDIKQLFVKAYYNPEFINRMEEELRYYISQTLAMKNIIISRDFADIYIFAKNDIIINQTIDQIYKSLQYFIEYCATENKMKNILFGCDPEKYDIFMKYAGTIVGDERVLYDHIMNMIAKNTYTCLFYGHTFEQKVSEQSNIYRIILV